VLNLQQLGSTVLQGPERAAREPFVSHAAVINLVCIARYKMVMILHSLTGSLTWSMSHGGNLYLITSVNLEKYFWLLVLKYIV